MNVVLPSRWEQFIRQLVKTGRYSNANEVVRAGLQKLQEAGSTDESFPPGSLKHLYTREENACETALAKSVRTPTPDEA